MPAYGGVFPRHAAPAPVGLVNHRNPRPRPAQVARSARSEARPSPRRDTGPRIAAGGPASPQRAKTTVGPDGRAKLPPSLAALIPDKYKNAVHVGDSAEDIAKWREERRKHWPSADTMARKVRR